MLNRPLCKHEVQLLVNVAYVQAVLRATHGCQLSDEAESLTYTSLPSNFLRKQRAKEEQTRNRAVVKKRTLILQ